MDGNKEKLVIIGSGETAEIAYEYFKNDSDFRIVGFSVERDFLKRKSIRELPVVALEEIEQYYDPKNHRAFIAVSYTQLNRLRIKLFKIAKMKGYSLVTYKSSNSYIANNVEIGENSFILENASIQWNTRIGSNVTIWSGSSIGHSSIVGDHCFIASHVAISGLCDIKENCFFGVNSCTTDQLKIARDCVIGAGAVLIKDTIVGKIYVGNPAKAIPNKTTDVFISGKETI